MDWCIVCTGDVGLDLREGDRARINEVNHHEGNLTNDLFVKLSHATNELRQRGTVRIIRK